jgi:hypothetical protein
MTWLKLGVVCGLAMLTKYSAVLIFASFFVYLVWQRLWSNPLVIRGVFISTLVFMLVFSPNVLWLIRHDWLSITYLNSQLSVSDSRLRLLSGFFANLGTRLWYGLLAVGFLSKISPRKVAIIDTFEPFSVNNDRRFLLTMLFTPLILAILPLLITGSQLDIAWVSAFFFPSGIVLVLYFFLHYDEAQLLQNTRRLVWGIQIIFLLVFFAGKVLYPATTGSSVQTNFPGKLLAEKASAMWRENSQQPLTIVIANTWLGGNLLLHARPEPTLLIDNNTVISPWVNHQDVASCGALVLTDVEKDFTKFTDLFRLASATGTFSLNWGYAPRGEVVQLAWAVLIPEPNQPPCRFSGNK